MADLTPEEIRHHVKTYVIVFVALAFFHRRDRCYFLPGFRCGASVVLALGVASVKGALVASYFMHLIDEKITIYWTLLITAAMFLILMLLPLGNMLAQTKI